MEQSAVRHEKGDAYSCMGQTEITFRNNVNMYETAYAVIASLISFSYHQVPTICPASFNGKLFSTLE